MKLIHSAPKVETSFSSNHDPSSSWSNLDLAHHRHQAVLRCNFTSSAKRVSIIKTLRLIVMTSKRIVGKVVCFAAQGDGRAIQIPKVRLISTLPSTTNGMKTPSESKNDTKKSNNADKNSSQKKTMAELDEEMRQKMSALAGDGGESGVEYEDGKPVAMKRSVRENMYRYI